MLRSSSSSTPSSARLLGQTYPFCAARRLAPICDKSRRIRLSHSGISCLLRPMGGAEEGTRTRLCRSWPFFKHRPPKPCNGPSQCIAFGRSPKRLGRPRPLGCDNWPQRGGRGGEIYDLFAAREIVGGRREEAKEEQSRSEQCSAVRM